MLFVAFVVRWCCSHMIYSHVARPAMRLVQILQKDLLKDVAFSQYQQSRLAAQQQQQATHEERASAEKEARLRLRNLVHYARTVIGHATRLLDAALDTTARLALLREKEERERLEKEEREKGELEKPEGMDHVEEDGKASSATAAAAATADQQNNQLPPATRRPQGGSAATPAAPVDERVREALVQGIVLRIVRPLATALCLFLDDAPSGGANSRLHQHLASSLLSPLVSLLKSLGTAPPPPPPPPPVLPAGGGCWRCATYWGGERHCADTARAYAQTRSTRGPMTCRARRSTTTSGRTPSCSSRPSTGRRWRRRTTTTPTPTRRRWCASPVPLTCASPSTSGATLYVRPSAHPSFLYIYIYIEERIEGSAQRGTARRVR